MIHNKHHWHYKMFMAPQPNKSAKCLHTAPSYIRTTAYLRHLK